MLKNAIYLITYFALFLSGNSAFSHVVLQEQVALGNTSYRAVFRVGHGCDGLPTTSIRVLLPAGFRGAQPMPHPGWQVDMQRAALAQPYRSHGKDITHDVAEVQWTAKSADDALPADQYDEFVLRGTLPEVAGTPAALWFKVLQSCASADGARRSTHHWAEVPTTGTSTRGLTSPAALLEVPPNAPAGATAAVHHH
ncbi:MAG: hypothetical protein RLZZ126_1880 [Pseudomonadota bacterium]|jgi:uncharacterized protein YcnI